MLEVRFEVDITFRCNLSCALCDRLIGKLPISESDLNLDDLSLAAERLKEAEIRVSRVKVTGGEPLVHPDVKEICHTIRELWPSYKSDGVFIIICTNGILRRPRIRGVSVSTSPLPKKHVPFTLSPLDMGISPVGNGYERMCRVQKLCGMSFDVFGFNFCPYAGIIGRILGIDTYSPTPVVHGDKRICQHCIYSVPTGKRWKIQQKALAGEIKFPSPTFREGLERNQKHPTHWKKFRER